MSIELKIKAKHLAAEARIIKDEAKKLKARARKAALKQREDVAKKLRRSAWDIRQHNKDVVRCEARATHLARAYIRGTAYKTVERSTVDVMDCRIIDRIVAMVTKYHDRSVTKETIRAWIAAE